jgi:ParB family chromosome partitioning protein
MKKKNLALKEIFLEDERFRTSYYFSLDKLILSIQKVGLLNPPLVALRDRHYILVSGWKRVFACLKLGLSSLPVLVLEEEDELKTFLTAFYENLATREFSLLEKAEILNRLKKFGEEKEVIVRNYLPLVDIPSTLSHLESYLTFSRFESGTKRIIHQKNMQFSSVKLLAGFTSKERKLLLPLLQPSGQNRMKEILEDLKEISRRNDLAPQEILSSKEILDIMDSGKLSPLQKVDKIRLNLKKRRYPALFSRKECFDSLVKKLRLPKTIAVRPSPFFEDEKLSIDFSCGNSEELKNNVLRLQALASKKEFRELFKLK